MADGIQVNKVEIIVEAQSDNAVKGIGRAVESLDELKKKFGQAMPEAADFSVKIKDTGKSAEKASSGWNKLLKSIGRIAFYRAIRSALKAVTEAFKEGVQNLVQYSAAIGNVDSAMANPTMSAYATKLLQVKNAIGAAVAPLLQALLPVVNTVSNAFITATNAVNQFISALQGKSTWTAAKEYPIDYAESLNKATGAAKEFKKQIMGFDELNVINAPNQGGGGGGSQQYDYSQMFEDREIDLTSLNGVADIIERIKKAFNGLEEALNKIPWEKVKGALSFFLSQGFIVGVNGLTDLATAIGGLLNGDLLAFLEGMGDFGFDALLTNIVPVLSVISLFTGIDFTGFMDMLDAVRKFNFKKFLNDPLGETKKLIDGIKEGGKKLGEDNLPRLEAMINTWNTFKEKVAEGKEKVELFFSTFHTELMKASPTYASIVFKIDTLDAKIQLFVFNVKEWLKDIKKDIKDKIDDIKTKIDDFKDKVNEFKQAAKEAFADFEIGLMNTSPAFAKVKYNLDAFESKVERFVFDVKQKLSTIWDGIVEGIKAPFNGAIGYFEKFINNIIDGMNKVIQALNNTILKVGSVIGIYEQIAPLSHVSIPRFASGGIVGSAGQLFIANEQTPELVGNVGRQTVVMNNSQIVDAVSMGVARAVASVMSGGSDTPVNVNVDGDTLFSFVVRKNNNAVFSTGASPLLV